MVPGGEEKLAERKGEASLASSGKPKLSFEKNKGKDSSEIQERKFLKKGKRKQNQKQQVSGHLQYVRIG